MLPSPPTHAWYILSRIHQLGQRPIGVELLNRPLTLFKDQAGQPGLLTDRCPHRNAKLSEGHVQDGCVVCPYHGWRFDREGACVAVPGLVDLPSNQAALNAQAFPNRLSQGFVWGWAGDEDPQVEPYQIPLLDDPAFTHLFHTEQMVGALPNILENFLDGLHTHYVHAGLIRTEGKRKPVDVTVRAIPNGVEAEYREEAQTGLISRIFGAGITHQIGRFLWPSIAQLEYKAEEETRLLLTLAFTPTRVGQSGERDVMTLHAVASGKVPFGLRTIAKWGIRPFLAQALRQDQAILDQQHDNLDRFGEVRYVYTELDVLMPHILRLLKHGPDALKPDLERHSTMWL